MNRLLFLAMVVAGWILFTAIDQGFFFDRISAQQSPGLANNPLQNQIQSELYSSISTGMSYEEVSSIIGWEGVLIYEDNINDGGEVIQTKVYRWNSGDLHLNNIGPNGLIKERNNKLGRNVVLEFQNGILTELDLSNQGF